MLSKLSALVCVLPSIRSAIGNTTINQHTTSIRIVIHCAPRLACVSVFVVHRLESIQSTCWMVPPHMFAVVFSAHLPTAPLLRNCSELKNDGGLEELRGAECQGDVPKATALVATCTLERIGTSQGCSGCCCGTEAFGGVELKEGLLEEEQCLKEGNTKTDAMQVIGFALAWLGWAVDWLTAPLSQVSKLVYSCHCPQNHGVDLRFIGNHVRIALVYSIPVDWC
jgi:hypothetical protein